MKIAHQKKKLKTSTQNWRKNIHQTYPSKTCIVSHPFFLDLTSLVEPIARPDRWWSQGTHNPKGWCYACLPQKMDPPRKWGVETYPSLNKWKLLTLHNYSDTAEAMQYLFTCIWLTSDVTLISQVEMHVQVNSMFSQLRNMCSQHAEYVVEIMKSHFSFGCNCKTTGKFKHQEGLVKQAVAQ